MRILSIENGADWLPSLFHSLDDVYAKLPAEFTEHPIDAFKRCVYLSPFWEEKFSALARLMGTDHIVFGSDWPHPEGLADPITFVDDLADMEQSEIAQIMGGNMMDLLKITAPVPA